MASVKPDQSVKANGFSHSMSKGVGFGAVPAKNCQRAVTMKMPRARYWMPSRMFWMRSPISTPRQLTHVIAAMKTTATTTTRQSLLARSCPINDQK